MFMFYLDQNILNPGLQYWLHVSRTEYQNILSVWMAFIVFPFPQKVSRAEMLFIIQQLKMILEIIQKAFPSRSFHVLSSSEKEIIFIHFLIA